MRKITIRTFIFSLALVTTISTSASAACDRVNGFVRCGEGVYSDYSYPNGNSTNGPGPLVGLPDRPARNNRPSTWNFRQYELGNTTYYKGSSSGGQQFNMTCNQFGCQGRSD